MIDRAHDGEHPEELLDLAVSGELDETQARTLREHLAHCRPCSAQLRMAGWIRKNAENNLAVSHLRDRATVSRALDRWQHSAPQRRGWRVPRWAALSAAALAISGAALAGSWWSGRRATPTEASTATHRAKPAPAPASSLASTDPPTPTPDAAASPAPAEAAKAAADALKPAEQPSAAALFARASEERLKGQRSAAAATFQRLQSLYPGSRESQTSHLVLGRMWLDGARPELAAPEFARYLASSGAAHEEALVGHATALRRLGLPAAEAADWQRLLDKFPRSVYAADARRRLEELRQLPNPSAPRNAAQP